jgi:CIC family chloride channel protein
MGLALIVGVGAGLGAVVLVRALRFVSLSVIRLAELGPPLAKGWLFLFIPAGIWLAWAISAKWAPEAAGHGVPQILAAIAVHGGADPMAGSHREDRCNRPHDRSRWLRGA